MILTAKNICKTYNGPPETQVLKGVCLKVPEASSTAIMGKSGEGKSTLLHILGTLEEPSSGQILIAGEEVKPSNYPKIRSEKIGFVFQFYNLLEEETLLDNLLLPIRIRRLPIHKQSFHYARAHDLLAQVGLEERKNLSSKRLSGGEKQRAAIARALIGNPSVILADEPSGNLDSTSSELIHELLLNLTEKEKKSLIVVTHDSNLAKLCHHKYELRNGVLCKF